MCIVKMAGATIHQLCDECGDKNVITVASLQIGDPRGTDENIIALPECPNCGSFEFLNRTHDTIAADKQNTFSFEHRSAVNRLHQQLHDDDKFSAQALRDKVNAEAPENKPPHVAVGMTFDVERGDRPLPPAKAALKAQGGGWAP